MSLDEKQLQFVSSMITEAYNLLIKKVEQEIAAHVSYVDHKFDYDLKWAEYELNGDFDGLKNDKQRNARFWKDNLVLYEGLIAAERAVKVTALERKNAELYLDKRKSELRVINMQLRVEELAHANTSNDA